MSVEERVANLEQAFLALSHLAKRADERHESVAQSINLLTELIQRHDARFGEVQAEQSNADVRLAALADAQIRTEEALRALTVKVDALTDAQQHTDERLKALIDIIQGERNGQAE
jgi:vacuolar-type H+-ATPase subunit I/STV1